MRPPLDRDALRALLRSPRTWAVLARHAVPVLGALFLGWLALESIAAVVLDTQVSLWCVGAIATWFVTRERAGDDADRFETFTNWLVTFAFVAAILVVPVAVPAAMLWFAVLQRSGLDPQELLRSGALLWTFAGLVVLQLPRFVEFVTTRDAAGAQAVLKPETGFLIRRLILVAMACSYLGFLSGQAVLIASLAVTQIVLAAHEVLGDRLFEPTPAAAGSSAAGGAPARERRRRRGP